MKMAKFTVDVYGDTVCPWCYIGKKSLDAAIARHKTVYPDDEFQLKWRPYLLYPNAKISGPSLPLDPILPSTARHLVSY